MSRKDKPRKTKIVSSICSFALIGAGGTMFFSGIGMLSAGIFAIALLGIFGQVMLGASAEGVIEGTSEGVNVLDVLTGVLEAFLDGVMVIVEAIASIFSF